MAAAILHWNPPTWLIMIQRAKVLAWSKVQIILSDLPEQNRH